MRIELKKDRRYIQRKRRKVFRRFTQILSVGFTVAFFIFISRGIDSNVNFLAALLCEVLAGAALWIGGSFK